MTHQKHHRRSIRLKNYDYSQPGGYFITICTYKRRCLFGKIVNGKMILNKFGKIAQQCWLEIPKHFPNVELDEFIVMPNHIHGIILINDTPIENNIINVGVTLAVTQKFVGATFTVAQNNNAQMNPNPTNIVNRTGASPAPTVGNIIGAYKSIVANACLKIFKENNKFMGKLWQRNYYEHIIRNETELNKIREYIINNPLKWELDIENPEKKKEYQNITKYFDEILK